MYRLPYRQVHLDFHTPQLPYRLGQNFDKNVFQERLRQGHVNSITLTARCHHGHIYYDTRFSAKHPQMQGDFLMELVDACHEIGVKCPLYITAGWDAYMADRHPEWLERNPDGSLFGFENFGQLEPGWKTLCFNTDYLDYLFAQTKETMEHFAGKLDGLFFDIIRQDPCCCNRCMEKMLEAGFDPEIYEDRVAFGLETKSRFKKELSAFIHKIDPDCSIFYNEGNITPAIRPNLADYSHFEIESLASGDWGYQHFPVAVRYAKNLGKEYLGMTGKFFRNWADFGSYKNQAGLEYECFLAAAHGAKCSIGDQMYGDGILQEATYKLIGAVYQQIERLQPWLEEAKAVPEVAVMHTNLYTAAKIKVDVSLAGAVNMLNEAHIQFDIIDDHMDFDRYKVIVLPDKVEAGPDLAEKLECFVKGGGKILASYHGGRVMGSDQSIPALGIGYVSEAEYEPMYAVYSQQYDEYLGKGEQVLHGKGMYVTHRGTELGELWEPIYNRTYQHYYSHYQAPIHKKSNYPLAVQTEAGIYFAHELFSMYKNYGIREYKWMILKALGALLKRPFVETNAPSTADVVLNHQREEQRLVLNYLNYVPERRAIRVETIEQAAPVYNTVFTLQMADIFDSLGLKEVCIGKVKAIVAGQELEFGEADGAITFVLPELKGYEVIELSYGAGTR